MGVVTGMSRFWRRMLCGILVATLVYLTLLAGAWAWLDIEMRRYEANKVDWVASVGILEGLNIELRDMPASMRGHTKEAKQYPLDEGKGVSGDPSGRKSLWLSGVLGEAGEARRRADILWKTAFFNNSNTITVLDNLGIYKGLRESTR
jgi:hypothetical protein